MRKSTYLSIICTMNLKQLENKTIYLLGKSRAFSSDEFLEQLALHNISVVQDASHDMSSLEFIVEGRMITPYEQIISDDFYEKKTAPFISIDALEKALAENINEDSLLMGLKLSRDKERLLVFLKNGALKDSFFLRLLKLYDFGGEGFFENDANRDVSAALIERFYENIERNHNVQYATLGLMHLVGQSKNPELIEALFSLEPLQKTLIAQEKGTNHSILLSLSQHPLASSRMLETIVKKGNLELQRNVALRKDISPALQEKLYEIKNEEILETLAYNPNLDNKLVDLMIKDEKYIQTIMTSHRITDDIFEHFYDMYKEYLAHNISLTQAMQEKLFATNEVKVLQALATNENVDSRLLEQLFTDEKLLPYLYTNPKTSKEKLYEAREDTRWHLALAENPNSPTELLKELAKSVDAEVLGALAKNSKTPIDILYQLQLDSRFERFVKENSSFGAHIQTHNIGWL